MTSIGEEEEEAAEAAAEAEALESVAKRMRSSMGGNDNVMMEGGMDGCDHNNSGSSMRTINK